MESKDHWTATKELITGFTHPLQRRGMISLFAHLHTLVPFTRCSVWAWKALLEPLIFNGDLHHRVVTHDGEAGFQVDSAMYPGLKGQATERLLPDYEAFLETQVGRRAGVARFKGVASHGGVQGFCYNPQGNGVFSALVIQLEPDHPVEERDRVRLFECNLPMVSVLFEQGLLREKHEMAIRRIPSLSPRQRTILKLLAEGKSTPRMAHTLCVSERTVSWHLQNIYRKLDVCSRQEAIAYVNKRSLVDTV